MAKSIISIGTASAAPGKRGTGFIKVGEMPDGSPINTPVIILNGANDGPTVWLHALEDGNEYPGCLALMDLGVELVPSLDKMNGAIVAIPAVNVTAFRGNPWGGGIRNSPADLDGGIAFPRQYPGNPNGGFTAQSAAAIWEPLIKNANYFITCHGSGEIYGVDRTLLFKVDAPAYEKSVDLAKALNMHIVLTAGGDPKRGKSAIETLIEMGIPSVSVESNGGPSGVGLGFDQTSIKNGILNALRHLGVISGNPAYLAKYTYVHYEKGSGGIFSHKGGFFRSLVQVEERVKEGQDVGEMRNWFGEVVETVKSPVNGIVLGYWGKCPQIGSGQYRVFEIAVPNP